MRYYKSQVEPARSMRVHIILLHSESLTRRRTSDASHNQYSPTMFLAQVLERWHNRESVIDMAALGPGPLERALTATSLQLPRSSGLHHVASLPLQVSHGTGGAYGKVQEQQPGYGSLPPGYGLGYGLGGHWSEPRPPQGARQNPNHDPAAAAVRQRTFRERLDAQAGVAPGPDLNSRPAPVQHVKVRDVATSPGASASTKPSNQDPSPGAVQGLLQPMPSPGAPTAQVAQLNLNRVSAVDAAAGSEGARSVCLRCGERRCCSGPQDRARTPCQSVHAARRGCSADGRGGSGRRSRSPARSDDHTECSCHHIDNRTERCHRKCRTCGTRACPGCCRGRSCSPSRRSARRECAHAHAASTDAEKAARHRGKHAAPGLLAPVLHMSAQKAALETSRAQVFATVNKYTNAERDARQ